MPQYMFFEYMDGKVSDYGQRADHQDDLVLLYSSRQAVSL